MKPSSNANDFQASEEGDISGSAPEFLENQKMKKEAESKHKHGIYNHDFVPHHSTHGRSNSRTFGSNHEPGTVI
jgi:hypothetical protein